MRAIGTGQAITTKDGKLVITMTEQDSHNLNFQSGTYCFFCPPDTQVINMFTSPGMLQSWNKFCFKTGYVEVSMSLPGTSKTLGLWPCTRLLLFAAL
jgi:beta-glucanase (GH16 family)